MTRCTNTVDRWRCTSYCLCTRLSEEHGHFERHHLGVWVKYSDVEKMEREIEQLRTERDFARRELDRACQETREAIARETTALQEKHA